MVTAFFRKSVCFLVCALLLCACQPEMIQLPPERVATATAPASTEPAQDQPTPTQSTQPGSPEKQFTPMPLPTQAESPAMNEVPISPPYNSSLQSIIDQTRADLARQLSIDPSQIEVVEVSSVTWPDGSLGCPQPGMAYTQIVVDGLRIRLKTGGAIYEYHGGGARPPFLCKPG